MNGSAPSETPSKSAEVIVVVVAHPDDEELAVFPPEGLSIPTGLKFAVPTADMEMLGEFCPTDGFITLNFNT